jgi:hypothetical protein
MGSPELVLAGSDTPHHQQTPHACAGTLPAYIGAMEDLKYFAQNDKTSEKTPNNVQGPCRPTSAPWRT